MDRPNISKSDIPEDASISEPSIAASDDWVHELVAMTRPGIDMELPERGFLSRMLFVDPDDFD